MKSFALSLAFIMRFTATRKWPIAIRADYKTRSLSPVFSRFFPLAIFPSRLANRKKVPFRLGARSRFLGTGTSLNRAFFRCPSKNLGTGTTSKGSTRALFLGANTGLKRILSVATFFFMPLYDTANKTAGAKLPNENTIALWASKSLNNVLFSARA